MKAVPQMSSSCSRWLKLKTANQSWWSTICGHIPRDWVTGRVSQGFWQTMLAEHPQCDLASLQSRGWALRPGTLQWRTLQAEILDFEENSILSFLRETTCLSCIIFRNTCVDCIMMVCFFNSYHPPPAPMTIDWKEATMDSLWALHKAGFLLLVILLLQTSVFLWWCTL